MPKSTTKSYVRDAEGNIERVRMTDHFSDGSSTDRDYEYRNSFLGERGKWVEITDHKPDGTSRSFGVSWGGRGKEKT